MSWVFAHAHEATLRRNREAEGRPTLADVRAPSWRQTHADNYTPLDSRKSGDYQDIIIFNVAGDAMDMKVPESLPKRPSYLRNLLNESPENITDRSVTLESRPQAKRQHSRMRACTHMCALHLHTLRVQDQMHAEHSLPEWPPCVA